MKFWIKPVLHLIAMKKLQNYFKKDRPKMQSESFFVAEINDRTKTCISIAALLLKSAIFLKS